MKSIYVIGAGASIGHMAGKYPAIDTFFQYAKEANLINESVKTIKQDYLNLQKYVLKIFNKDVMHKNDKINIEDLLTYLDIENEYDPTTKIFDIKEDVINIIRNTLINLIDLKNSSEYHLFSKNITTSDTIITFNWDILLDNILGRLRYHDNSDLSDISAQYRRFVNEFSGMREDIMFEKEFKQPYSIYRNNIGLYIKLHGSLDWFYCPNNSCPAHIRPFSVTDPIKKNYCGECHSILKPLIIPPVLNKPYKSFPFINLQWNTAIKEMEIANKLVIWGYSIPPTDFQSNWLLRQVQNYNVSVDLINPECKTNIGTKENPLYSINTEYNRRVRQIFKNMKNMSIRYFDNYKDYSDELTIIKKYHIKI